MPGILYILIASLALTGCVMAHPKDLELVSVQILDNRLIAELPAPSPPSEYSLVDPYREYLLAFWEKQQSEPISPSNMQPYFDWYSKNEDLQQLKTSEPVLKIEFSSESDLAKEAFESGQIISAHQFLCSRPDYPVLLGPPGIYIQGLELTGLSRYDVAPNSGLFTYYVFVDVSDVPKTPSTYRSYDLLRFPEAVCIQVQRGAMGFGYKSNVVVVPAEAITTALEEANVDAADTLQ